MKNFTFRILFLLVSLFSINTVSAQNEEELPHATIHFVRSGNFFGSGCRTDIELTNQQDFNLPLASVVHYKMYSEGEILVTLSLECPATKSTSASSTTTQITLNVKRGNEYYVLFSVGKKGGFKEVTKAEVEEFLAKNKNIQKHEESLDNPINRKSVESIGEKSGKGQGTCFLISSEGYLVTNYHCIENAKEIMVKGIDGDFTTKYGATVVATDPANDLALLKLGNRRLQFGNPPTVIRSSGVQQAEKVYVLGYPAAQVMGQEIKITDGIISSKSGVQGDISKFQISAAVNHGNSGCPLLDVDGNLIGVVYAKSTIAESAGYAIKASYLEVFLKNVDGFTLPIVTNQMKDLTLSQKVDAWKKYIFIVETN